VKRLFVLLGIVVICVLLVPLIFTTSELIPENICGNNLRQIGMAVHLYKKENKQYPENFEDLSYILDVPLTEFKCPNSSKFEYKIMKFPKPIEKVIFSRWEITSCETDEGGRNVLYLDGHVSFENKKE